MNILTAGRLMFAKKLALNLLMSVAIGLALFFCNMLICNFNGILQANAPTYFYQDETLYFQPMRIYGEPVFNFSADYLAERGAEFEIITQPLQGDGAALYACGKNTAAGLSKQLESGVCCGISEGETECMVVSPSRYSVGDTFTQSFNLKDKPQTFTFKVTGVLKSNAKALSAGAGGTALTGQNLFTDLTGSGEKIVCCSYELQEVSSTYGNALVFFNNSTAGQIAEVREYLKNTAVLLNMRELRANASAESYGSQALGMSGVSILILGMLGAIAVDMLTILDNKKLYRAYFVSGMKKSQCFALGAAFAVWVALCAAATFALIFLTAALGGFITISSLFADWKNILFTFGVLTFIILFSGAATVPITKKLRG